MKYAYTHTNTFKYIKSASLRIFFFWRAQAALQGRDWELQIVACIWKCKLCLPTQVKDLRNDGYGMTTSWKQSKDCPCVFLYRNGKATLAVICIIQTHTEQNVKGCFDMSAVISHSQNLGHSLLRDLQNLLTGNCINKSIAVVTSGNLFTNHITSAKRNISFSV